MLKSEFANKRIKTEPIGSCHSDVDAIRTSQRQSERTKYDDRRAPCRACGRRHDVGNCPARGKECRNCGKQNHFAACCFAKPRHLSQNAPITVRQIENFENSPRLSLDNREMFSIEHCQGQAESIATIAQDNLPKEKIFAHLVFCGRKIRFLLDTGATCNVISRSSLPENANIVPTSTILKLYGTTVLQPLGEIEEELRNPKNGERCKAKFIVVPSTKAIPLLGAQTAQLMNLVEVKHSNICHADKAIKVVTNNHAPRASVSGMTKADILVKFPTVFDGKLGLMEGDIHLEVLPWTKKTHT